MQFDIQGDIAFLQRAGVLKQLLKDRTTGRHILWGTDAYADKGLEYARDQEIEIRLITGENSGLLKTRAQKAAEQQTERTRQHAEVFTPAWICQMMNDQADREWSGSGTWTASGWRSLVGKRRIWRADTTYPAASPFPWPCGWGCWTGSCGWSMRTRTWKRTG